MYHCHFEETEHVHMGMVGVVFVRPGDFDQAFDRWPPGYCLQRRDAPSTTASLSMMLNEVWTLAHWCDSHVQLPEWSDYAARLLAAQRPGLSRHDRSRPAAAPTRSPAT